MATVKWYRRSVNSNSWIIYKTDFGNCYDLLFCFPSLFTIPAIFSIFLYFIIYQILVFSSLATRNLVGRIFVFTSESDKEIWY